ncbi:hypothetical protein KCP73_04395 [Salmonella enterica subsp. enterica]|nr:hypothetical protein KCP73_04395 [Salmonella enterica subsp. enterica]
MIRLLEQPAYADLPIADAQRRTGSRANNVRHKKMPNDVVTMNSAG